MTKIKIELYLEPVNTDIFMLPIHHNHIVQALIYDLIGDELALFLHNLGFVEGKRSFKMFTFSRIIGKFKLEVEGQKIVFEGPLKLVISSPVVEFCNSLVNKLLLQGEVRIGSSMLKVVEVRGKKPFVNGEQLRLRTLSPVVLYSTLFRTDGRKYTCYFQPGESDFEKLLGNNLRNKYSAFYNEEAPAGEVKVKALDRPKMALIKYKEIIIKGSTGKFFLTGPQALLQLAVDSGIGSKGSQGFGCVEIV